MKPCGKMVDVHSGGAFSEGMKIDRTIIQTDRYGILTRIHTLELSRYTYLRRPRSL